MADPPVTVKVKGLREFERGAMRLAGNIDGRVDASFRTVADQTATLVRARVPRRTGRLAASLSGQSATDGATVGYDLIYAGPVDYGGWPPGRPYIPQGRYLYPAALDAVNALKRAGELAAAYEIGRMIWPVVTGI